MKMKTDIVIVGCGVSGLYCALKLPQDKQITIVTKEKARKSDSYLAQGGICVLKEKEDYDSFFEDTMRAGHYENNPDSVEIMINSSKEIIDELVDFGVEFERDENGFVYTREGAHSKPRILFHQDETGKEITSKLLSHAKKRGNINIIEDFTMVDIICRNNICYGIIGQTKNNELISVLSDYTVFATGGIGGLFKHSTNYRHLTGDAIAISLKHGIKLKDIDYIQIHPTTLYSRKDDRSFLISESVRGEGAILLNSAGERFVDELQPRDIVANAIYAQMEKEGSKYVWMSLENIPEKEIKTHFPNIYMHCLEEGYDITKECIPVVPSQHYFMGGIEVDSNSKTSMEHLYAVGETACNGVHGKNRLASNSLLESLVFAKRSAINIAENYSYNKEIIENKFNESEYFDWTEKYKQSVLDAIEKEKNKNE